MIIGISKLLTCLRSVVLLSFLVTSTVYAHLMVAQHGTLKFNGDGAFMMLSLPVSAFDGIDNDGDGKMSALEFRQHKARIVEIVHQEVTLQDAKGNRPLQGLMLSPSQSHSSKKSPSEHIVVMGRFALASKAESYTNELKFTVGLFGNKVSEQLLDITAIKTAAANAEQERYQFLLTPTQVQQQLFD